jgi:hypothetical protein
MKRLIIICLMHAAMQVWAQEDKCILFSDTAKTPVEAKITNIELKDMTLILQVPVIDSVEDYWYLGVELHSDFTNYYFMAKFDSVFIKENCIGKEFIYLTVVAPHRFSDFSCSNRCNEGELLRYDLLCNKSYISFWAEKNQKYQTITATVTYLGKWLYNYNGSDVYERKEIKNDIIKIKMK